MSKILTNSKSITIIPNRRNDPSVEELLETCRNHSDCKHRKLEGIDPSVFKVAFLAAKEKATPSVKPVEKVVSKEL